MGGRLILCGTPIGNLDDASPRLAATLEGADAVFAEDTRRARALLDRLGVAVRPESYFAGNEARRAARLARLLEGGATVALITDAGMPGVADPGLSAVRAARRAGAAVSVAPGPSAVSAALAVSGLAADRFVFEGFLPRTGRERAERLEMLAAEVRTIVLFSAPARVAGDLAALSAALGGDRRAAVARELTKVYEEVWSGTLAGAAAEWRRRTPRGEFTLVVEGSPGAPPPLEAAVREVEARTAGGARLSEAVRSAAEGLGLNRRALYEAVLRGRGR